MPDPDSIQSMSVEAFKILLNNLTNVKDFVLEQAPDICRQIVVFGFASHIAYIVIALIVMTISCVAFSKCSKYSLDKSMSPDDAFGCFLGACIAGCFVIACFVSICNDAITLIKIIVAPKLYLIQYIMDLVHNNKH